VNLEACERFAVALAHSAGEKALTAFHGTVVREFKGRREDDLVTSLDREVESFLRTALRREYPTHGLLGEEQADDIAADASYIWVLDPIDGTMNFASGVPLFGISIGLLQDGAPVLGCIWVPVGPTLGPGVFHARVGGEAWFDDRPVHVSRADDERGQIMALPAGHLRAFRFRRAQAALARPARALPDSRTTGSCTAELALIASGGLRAGVFIRPSIWDVAAGVLIVRQAGGTVLTWSDRQWMTFERFLPQAPSRGKGEPTFRHWGRPLLLGAPEAVERLTARMAWHPRLPRPLQQLIGL
jgi:myo-inositol-1(or 4)-monophosphatase